VFYAGPSSPILSDTRLARSVITDAEKSSAKIRIFGNLFAGSCELWSLDDGCSG
jgi:hypothetical protein